MISVNEFLMKVKPKSGSKLLPFREDILKLKKADLSNQKICEFLKLNGVEVSHQRVAVFLKEQGFNKTNQSSKVVNGINADISEKKHTEIGHFGDETMQPEAEFAKPAWVPKHINIEDLK